MISFLNLLTVVFIVLKLTEVIDWSWWFVLLPSILFSALVATFLIVATSLGFQEKPKLFK